MKCNFSSINNNSSKFGVDSILAYNRKTTPEVLYNSGATPNKFVVG